jgi:hypothetical protein
MLFSSLNSYVNSFAAPVSRWSDSCCRF